MGIAAWLRAVAVAGVAALASSAFASAPYREVTTSSWKAKIPDTWKLTVERRFGLDHKQGRWAFRSPKGNGFLRVTLWNDVGEDFAKLEKHYHGKILERVSEPKVLQETRTKDGKDEVGLKVFRGLMVRTEFMREYLFAHVLVRKAAEKLLVVVTLGTTDEKLEDFMKILETFMESFDYIKPAPTTKAPPKKGGTP